VEGCKILIIDMRVHKRRFLFCIIPGAFSFKVFKKFYRNIKKILEKIQWGITNPEFYSDFKTVFKKLLRSISQNHLSTVPVPVTGNKSEDKKS
jgi:hypothetical protein